MNTLAVAGFRPLSKAIATRLACPFIPVSAWLLSTHRAADAGLVYLAVPAPFRCLPPNTIGRPESPGGYAWNEPGGYLPVSPHSFQQATGSAFRTSGEPGR